MKIIIYDPNCISNYTSNGMNSVYNADDDKNRLQMAIFRKKQKQFWRHLYNLERSAFERWQGLLTMRLIKRPHANMGPALPGHLYLALCVSVCLANSLLFNRQRHPLWISTQYSSLDRMLTEPICFIRCDPAYDNIKSCPPARVLFQNTFPWSVYKHSMTWSMSLLVSSCDAMYTVPGGSVQG